MYELKDNYNRFFSYLRLSLTDLCNFQCNYCMPKNFKVKDKNYLSLTEINNLIEAFSELGVTKIRLTGGEPTLRKDFINIIKNISNYSSIKSIVFTTNGHNLKDIINEIKLTRVSGINISLDTLEKNKFETITNKNQFLKVYEGIMKALDLNIDVKLNVVLSDLFSIKDFENFYSLIKYKKINIRFINKMETNFLKNVNKKNFNITHMLTFLKKENWKIINEKTIISGPALMLENNNFIGKIGIINPYSNSFCLSCNRLRISSEGNLFLCLFGGKNYPLRHFLDSKRKKKELQKFLIETVKIKSYSHFLTYKNFGELNTFSAIGG